jgi:hypothetical protein
LEPWREQVELCIEAALTVTLNAVERISGGTAADVTRDAA